MGIKGLAKLLSDEAPDVSCLRASSTVPGSVCSRLLHTVLLVRQEYRHNGINQSLSSLRAR